ncbi:phosphoenolpyruvate hydrolase family protein [Paenibacillus motobuensis]|uniref:phosphoenolpyruvate hydrolase family protein n=1 Tax=Paenibacillus TaxID=44249 RepID=UPI00203BB7BF|nr:MULTISPECIES: phosphoenolpyruvate hydrolase family protein [Paenibacillus]MCM3042465.1 phosphoenolpyruvate hydrolase family protein [Paenibacillus lutimineralis]MCM3649569.1 phosphoenolpyruvate hydrolase family protein [Paenibacillus motobuensis]
MTINRKRIVEHMHAQIHANEYIIGVAAGAGISAKYAVKGGADLILALNSGRFRQMGLGSIAGLMPFANSNEMVMEFGSREILSVVRDKPVVFGLCASDPTIDLPSYIETIRGSGFAGIINYPTLGLIDGQFREALEEEGISYLQEVEAISVAHEQDLFTMAFVFNAEQAAFMLDAGADVICAHLGVTAGGLMGTKKVLSLETSAELARQIFAVCDASGRSPIKLIYGGPVHTPIDVQYMYDNTSAMGYVGGSSFERIPTEEAIVDTTYRFKVTGELEQDQQLMGKLTLFDEPYDYVAIVKEHIAQNYMNNISLTDLADQIHVSRTHLSALFNKEVGCSFPEYLAKYRIHKAQDVMRHTKLSLTSIAELVGYPDYVHFSKTFKKYTGMTPQSFRKQASDKYT